MQFEISDGQTVSVWFNNPDANPNQISGSDTVVSWKWLLNSRDVTVALQPKNGENVNVAKLAERIMILVAKNSKRFASAQKRKGENQQAIDDAVKRVDELTQNLAELDSEINQLRENIEQFHAKKDDEPIVLTGDEFGYNENMPIEELREKAVEYLNNLAKSKDTVYCPALNAEVKFGTNNNRKFGSLSAGRIKLFMARQIKQIIQQAKVFKPSQDAYDANNNKMTYHYLKAAVMYEEKEYGARIVIRKDSNGNYHYDLQVNADGVGAILDSLNVEKAEVLLATNQGLFGFDNNTTSFDGLSQAMFDKLKTTNMVLNLFIFDKDGNEVLDEPTQSEEPVQNDENTSQGLSDNELLKLQRKTYGEANNFLMQHFRFGLDEWERHKMAEFLSGDRTLEDVLEEVTVNENWETGLISLHLMSGSNHQGELQEGFADKDVFMGIYKKFYNIDDNSRIDLNQDSPIETPYFTTEYRANLKDAYQNYLSRDDSFDASNIAELNYDELGRLALYVNNLIDYANQSNTAFLSSIAPSEKSYRKKLKTMFSDLKIPAIPTTYDGIKEWANKYTPIIKDVLLAGGLTQQNSSQAKNNTSQSDIDFLNDIIAGKVDVLADGFAEKIESVVERLDEQYPELTKQAVEYYIAETDKYAQETA